MTRDFPPARQIGLASLCVAMLLSGAPGLAHADDLDNQRKNLNSQMATSQAQMKEYSGKVTAAVNAYNASRDKLATAEANLAAAESNTAGAKTNDDARAADLQAAEAALASAKAEVVTAKAKVEEERLQMGEAVRENMLGINPLTKFALFIEDLKSSDISGRMYYTAAVFDSRAANMDHLTELQFKLEAAEVKAVEAQTAADAARQAAADQLAKTQQLEQAATQFRGEVASLVSTNAQLKKNAEDLLAAEKADYAKMEAESADLDKRIAARLAAQRAEAERLAKLKQTPSQPSTPSSSGGSYSSNSSLFWPAQGRPGSPFGMRLHPILGYYRMHWGTDIGAGCNTPLYAAYDGVVAEKFYSSGYGNRLVLDIGKINGSYLSIGYAHANKYVVSQGQRVSRGQVIGYVGSTGLSTECHLHLELWENGTKINPMKWF